MSRYAAFTTAALALVASLMLSTPALASDWVTCDGEVASIVGTDGDDVLYGTAFDDVIAGGRGDDFIDGRGGNDIICGGGGADHIIGNAGHDRLLGGPAIDVLEGGKGHDVLKGGNGRDQAFGGSGNDTIIGGGHKDWIDGQGGDDTLRGNDGGDVVKGGGGDDELHGGEGADKLLGNQGDDVIYGSPEEDRRIHGGGGFDQCDVGCEKDFVEEPPSVADDTISTHENQLTTTSVLADNGAGPDFDPDGDAMAVVAINGDPGLVGTSFVTPSGATLRVSAAGNLRYDPRVALDSMTDGETIVESLTYTLQDSTGLASVGSVTITVDGVNDAPVAKPDGATVLQQGSVTVDVLSNDSDVEGQSLAIASLDLAGTNGTATIENGVVRYTAAADSAGLGEGESLLDTFRYRVTDSAGASAWATVTVSVTGVNDAPTAENDITKTKRDKAVVIEVLNNDVELDSSDVLTVTLLSGPSNGGAVANPDGTITYTPNPGFLGSDSLTYRIQDTSGATSTAAVTISVVFPSDPGEE